MDPGGIARGSAGSTLSATFSGRPAFPAILAGQAAAHGTALL